MRVERHRPPGAIARTVRYAGYVKRCGWRGQSWARVGPDTRISRPPRSHSHPRTPTLQHPAPSIHSHISLTTPISPLLLDLLSLSTSDPLASDQNYLVSLPSSPRAPHFLPLAITAASLQAHHPRSASDSRLSLDPRQHGFPRLQGPCCACDRRWRWHRSRVSSEACSTASSGELSVETERESSS